MKFLKKTLVILLTACITFCSSSCLLLTYFRLPPRMSERVYERINEEDFYNLVEEIYQLCENKSGRKQLEKKRETLFIDYYNRSSTMAILAELNYYKDVTNQSAQEESVYADNLYTTIVNETLKVEKAIFNSVHKDYFVDAYVEDYL
ncbi:MAG: hypothetical protein IJW13_03935, partial [Clostridia bacterium]|nr:hypothetical protein [Clostridia bacterium]